MTSMLELMVRVYRLFLRLYPASFRSEFEEQMLLDFSDMTADAREMGRLSFILFCLHELVDFPLNLLRVHLREGSMFKIFRSQPVTNGLRGAIGFGLAFPTSVLGFIFISFGSEPMLTQFEVFYYDLFHALPLYEIISWIPSAVGFLLAGSLVGGLLAILFADRSNYSRYLLAGMLGWFLCRVTLDLSNSYQWAFFLGSRHSNYFQAAILVLAGAFLGLIFIVARSERREPLRLLMTGAIVYPLLAYLYVKLLFQFSIISTPWLFIALMILITVYMTGAFALAIKSGGGRKNLWLMIVSAIGYPLLAYAGVFIATWIYSPELPSLIYPGGAGFWPMVLAIATSQVMYGVLFGLLVGLVLGFQKKNNQLELATGN